MSLIRETILNTHSIVANRMRHVADIIDWDSVETICDIGSWNLDQSIEFMEILPDAKVYSFEGNPENYKTCEDVYGRLSGYFKENLKIYNTILSDETGKINFYPVIDDDENTDVSSKHKLMKGLSEEYSDNPLIKAKTQVDATTLDLWRVENKIDKVDIIWMDVQGVELDTLEGAHETLENVKCIFTEVGLKPYYEGQALKTEIDYFLKNEAGFVEIPESSEYNSTECESSTIYVKRDLL